MLSGLNANVQEMISIVFWSVNGYSSLVTWQMMLLSRANVRKDVDRVFFVSSTPQIRSLLTKFSKMVVFSSSVPSKLFSFYLVF